MLLEVSLSKCVPTDAPAATSFNWLKVGCFEDLRRFSDLSAISRPGAGDNQSLKS